jgi:O-antigen/teichoic acid export membrane protein
MSFTLMGLLQFLEFDFIPSFDQLRTVWILSIFNGFLSLVCDFLLVHARMLHRRRLFAVGALLGSCATLVVTIVLVVFLKYGIVGIALGQFSANAAVMAVIGIGLRNSYRLRFQSEMLVIVLKYSLPIVPGFCFGFFSSYIGKLFIYGSMGPAEVAILAICYKVTAGLLVFTQAFRMAWQPIAMAYIGEERHGDYYCRSMRVFLVAAFAGIVLTVATAKYLVLFLAPANYYRAIYYIPLFAIASVVAEAGANLELGNQISKKTFWLSIAAFLGFATNIGVLVILMGKFPLLAVAVGVLTSGLLSSVVTYISSRHNYLIHYDNKAFVIFGCGCCAVESVSVMMDEMNILLYWVVLAGIGVMVLSGMMSKDDRADLVRALDGYLPLASRIERGVAFFKRGLS